MKTSKIKNNAKSHGFALPSIKILLVFLVSFTSVFAAGRTGFPIAKTLMGPRSLALGGAVISTVEWPDGALINPAAAAGGNRQASVSFAQHSLDLWSGRLSASYPVQDNIISGVYLNTFNYGEFDYSERGTGETGETFTASEYLLGGYLSGHLNENISWGAALKYLWGSVENETASAAATDLGFTWDSGWEMFRFGGVLRNLGSEFSGYGAGVDPLPTEILLGGSKKLNHLPLTLHATAIFAKTGEEDWTIEWLPGDPGFGFSAGGEFEVMNDGIQRPFFIRLGYRSRGQGLQTGHRLDTIAGFTFGLGLGIKMIDVDYAFAPMGVLGDIHRFGISGTF